MLMNSMTFQNIVQGHYGRKTAYVNVEEINESNVVQMLGKTIGVFNLNKTAINYLWNYYKGDQPVLYRTKIVRDDIVNKIVENHAWEIVQFKNAQTYGEPLQYISVKKEDGINEAVDRLNAYAKSAGKPKRDIESGEWTSAVGTGYKAIQAVRGEVPFRITAPSPMNTYIIYSRTTDEPLASVQELRDEEDRTYYQVFTATHEYRIQNSQLLPLGTLPGSDNVVYSRLHAFGGIPIIEYPNNQGRISDIELVISMLDAVNTQQSDRTDAIAQFVQSWIKFVNCDIDEATFEKMKMMGALVVKSNNGSDNKADVDVMTQELNQTQAQVAKEDLLDNVYSILSIPNKESQNSGGDTAGAVSLRAGWDHAKQTARLKDAYVEDGDKRLGMLMLNRIRIANKEASLGIGIMDFDCQVNHALQDNMYIKAEVLKMLLDSGVHPLIASETCGLWSDSEKTYMMSKPYFDGKYKTAEQLEKEAMMQNGQSTQSSSNSSSSNDDPQFLNTDTAPRAVKRGIT